MFKNLVARIIQWARPDLDVRNKWVAQVIGNGDRNSFQLESEIFPRRLVLPQIKAGLVKPEDFPAEPDFTVYYPIWHDFDRKVVTYATEEVIRGKP